MAGTTNNAARKYWSRGLIIAGVIFGVAQLAAYGAHAWLNRPISQALVAKQAPCVQRQLASWAGAPTRQRILNAQHECTRLAAGYQPSALAAAISEIPR